jgi:hypothetical protein
MIHMNFNRLFCIAALVFNASQTNLAAEGVQLTGIINLPNSKLAIIAVNSHSLVLAEGERQGNVEMLSIDPVLASVRLRLDATNEIEANISSGSNLPPSTLIFENLQLGELMSIYQNVSKKTLLSGSAIPNSSFTLHANAASASEAASVIEKAIADNGLSIIPLGEHFAGIVPEYAKDKLKLAAPPAKPTGDANSNSELLRAGAINFQNVDLSQVATILAALKHQKIDAETIQRARNPLISLKTITALTKAEAVYAIETTLLLNGIRVVDASSDMLRLEPSDGR